VRKMASQLSSFCDFIFVDGVCKNMAG